MIAKSTDFELALRKEFMSTQNDIPREEVQLLENLTDLNSQIL